MQFKLSTLALALTSIISVGLINTVYAETQADETNRLPTINVNAEMNEQNNNLGYTVKKTNSSNKLNLDPQHTPQTVYTVTSHQIEDQNLNTTDAVLTQTLGVNSIRYGQVGGGYVNYYSRGLPIKNVQRDGIPTTTASFGGSARIDIEDSAIYDRIEVIKGATGLTNGSGQPSASINYVRKRPTAELIGAVKVQAGSWDNYRSQIDVSGPLNNDASIRGRTVAAYGQGVSQQDRFDQNNALFYGVLDFDLGANTVLSTALSWQQNRLNNATVHGLPFLSNDTLPKPTHFGPRDNAAANWTYSDTDKTNVFFGLEHQFNQNWKGIVNYNYTHAKNDRVYGVAGSAGLVYDSDYYNDWTESTLKPGEMIVTSGRNVESPAIHSLDIYTNGHFEVFGRKHQLSLGFNGYSTKSNDPSYTGTPDPVVKIDGWNGQAPRPDFHETGRTIVNDKQYGGFFALDLQLLDPLKLLAGSRISQWEHKTADQDQKYSDIWTPYIGLIYDLNEQHSVYVSYTSIFNPTGNENKEGKFLDPEEGNSLEVGLKGSYFNGRLNANVAYFQTKQNNFAIEDPTQKNILNMHGKTSYIAVDGAKIKGVELALVGELAPNLNLQVGYSYTDAKDRDGKLLNTALPKQDIKLFTTYQWQQWRIGGGINWQSEIYDSDVKGIYKKYNSQDSYILANLMGRYDINQDLSLGLNINNLFNKQYKANTTNTWGAERQVTGSLTYSF